MQSFFVIIFNFLVTRIMRTVNGYMSFHFTLQSKVTEYYALVISEFLLMGLTLTLVSQFNIVKMLEENLSNDTGRKWSSYDGFDGRWYYEIGSIITTTMIINCFWANLIELFIFARKGFSRLRDRDYKDNKKMDPDDDFCDDVNTNLMTQKELNDLYTGNPFNG